jgi:hypothetical protein
LSRAGARLAKGVKRQLAVHEVGKALCGIK